MKAVLIISSFFLTIALGDVVTNTNTFGTYLQTPDAITKMARSDTGYSYSVTSTRGHPSSFLYGVQPIGTPLALTYSSLGVNPIGYLTQNVLPYDYTTKHIIPKIVIPYSTVAFSPLVSHLSAFYQTSSIPSLLQDNMKPEEEAKKPSAMDQPMMMDQKPMLSQNPFFSTFVQMNNEMPQQNPAAENDPVAPSLQGNKVDDDTVSVESA